MTYCQLCTHTSASWCVNVVCVCERVGLRQHVHVCVRVRQRVHVCGVCMCVYVCVKQMLRNPPSCTGTGTVV